MKKMLYKILSKIVTFLGDIHFYGWKYPFWFIIKVPEFKLTGKHYEEVKSIILPGDILLRNTDRYLDSYMIPGFWTHAGIYIENNNVVHAISDGVVVEDLITFMRTDYLCVLRASESLRERCLALTQEIVNKEYDFVFDFNDTNRFSCTELVYFCYHSIIPVTKRWGKLIVIGDDIFKCDSLSVVYNSLEKVS